LESLIGFQTQMEFNNGHDGFEKNIPQTEWLIVQHVPMPNLLEQQLGAFIRKKRGNQTFVEFGRIVGLPPSTVHRLEQRQQSITLRNLQHIMLRMKCSLTDIFPQNQSPNRNGD